ncbi:hypothetical protein LCGC14_0726560 [marine sediment metagenome]|uniref:Uncharacterized protein n=1 Tax=marine sediment metagenome TaxID=412755 RepID=A0A0F9QAT8_9ZZZZ
MSLNKPPSFVGINQKEGTFTVAFLTAWYDVDRCDECPRFMTNLEGLRRVSYCECMEAEPEEPCEITGKRYTHEGEKNRTEA